MKNLISKSLLMAAVVGAAFTSCEKEPTVDLGNQPSGIMTEATLGVSVKSEISSKSSPNDVNMGDNIQAINNIAIVPMVGANYANPILLGNIAQDGGNSTSKVASVDQNTDGFLVYGGMVNALDENKTFVPGNTTFTLAKDESVTDWGTAIEVYKPYSLFYFLEAKKSDIMIGNTSSDNTWKGVSDWTELATTVGEAKYIKIKNVRYGVGALAVGVLDGVPTDADLSGNGDASLTWNDVKANIKLAGMTINNHPAELEYNFEPKEGAATQKVYVSINAEASNFVSKLAIASGKVTGANYYAPVAQCGDADHDVTLTFRFQNKTGNSIYVGKEMKEEVANDGYFYMNAIVRYAGSDATHIFAKFTTTLVNATLKDLSKATTEPVEPTEAEIGIEINTEWETGHMYDVEM